MAASVKLGGRGRPNGVHLSWAMEYVRLGSTGVMVSPLCLGAMMFGQWGNPDYEQGIEVISAALDAGINFIDTADVYSYGDQVPHSYGSGPPTTGATPASQARAAGSIEARGCRTPTGGVSRLKKAM